MFVTVRLLLGYILSNEFLLMLFFFLVGRKMANKLQVFGHGLGNQIKIFLSYQVMEITALQPNTGISLKKYTNLIKLGISIL